MFLGEQRMDTYALEYNTKTKQYYVFVTYWRHGRDPPHFKSPESLSREIRKRIKYVADDVFIKKLDDYRRAMTVLDGQSTTFLNKYCEYTNIDHLCYQYPCFKKKKVMTLTPLSGQGQGQVKRMSRPDSHRLVPDVSHMRKKINGRFQQKMRSISPM